MAEDVLRGLQQAAVDGALVGAPADVAARQRDRRLVVVDRGDLDGAVEAREDARVVLAGRRQHQLLGDAAAGRDEQADAVGVGALVAVGGRVEDRDAGVAPVARDERRRAAAVEVHRRLGAGVGEQLGDLDGRHAERLRLAAVGDEQQQRSAAVLEADRGARVDRAVARDDSAVADQHLVAADGELELLGDVAAERVVERDVVAGSECADGVGGGVAADEVEGAGRDRPGARALADGGDLAVADQRLGDVGRVAAGARRAGAPLEV